MTGSGKCFVHRYVDGGELRTWHPFEMEKVEGGIDDGDVHGYADCFRFLGACGRRQLGRMMCEMTRTVYGSHINREDHDSDGLSGQGYRQGKVGSAEEDVMC